MKTQPKVDMCTKLELDSDFLRVLNKFSDEHGSETITRAYWRKHSKYSDAAMNKYYDSWTIFMNANLDMNSLKDKKKLTALQQEVTKLKAENKQLYNTSNLTETILEAFSTKLEDFSLPKVVNAPKITGVNQEGKKAVLMLSDWHCGEEIKAEEICGINEADTNIVLKRADDVITKFIKYCHTIGVKEANIFCLGDLLAGNIHAELQRNQSENVVETLMILTEYLAKKFIEISTQFSQVNVVFISGNHGRLNMGDNKPFFKQAQQLNFEYILGKMVEQSTKGVKNLEIIVPKSPYHTHEINGKYFLLLHGDGLCGGGGGGFAGIPYYALASSAAKLYGALKSADIPDQQFDHILMGHLHAYAAVPLFNGGKLVVNSSLIGTGEYSLRKMKAVGSIEQCMLIVNKIGDIESFIRLIPGKVAK